MPFPAVLISWDRCDKVPPTSGLGIGIYPPPDLEAQGPKSRCRRGRAPSSSSRGGSSLPPPTVAVSLPSLPLSSCGFSSVSLCPLLSYKDTCHWIQGPPVQVTRPVTVPPVSRQQAWGKAPRARTAHLYHGLWSGRGRTASQGARPSLSQAPSIPLVTQPWPLAVLVGTVRTPIDVYGVPRASGSEYARKPLSAMRARAEPRSDRLTRDTAVTICVCAQSTVGNFAVRSCRYRRRVQGGPPAGAFPFAHTPPRPEATGPISRLLFLSRTRSARDLGLGPASPHVMATAITEKDTEVPRGTQQARVEARLSWFC